MTYPCKGRDRVRSECDMVVQRSRQGSQVRKPDRDGVACRIQIATGIVSRRALRTRPVGSSHSQVVRLSPSGKRMVHWIAAQGWNSKCRGWSSVQPFFPQVLLPLGLLSTTSKPQQRVRASHGEFREVSSVGRLCQLICTAGSLSGITAEEGGAIMNTSALLDAIPGTASVARGMGFRLASDRGDAFKGFKRGVCPGRDFDQCVKSFILARQSKGCSVQRRGDAVKLLRRISVVFGFRRTVRHGNHTRTMLGVWACCRRGGLHRWVVHGMSMGKVGFGMYAGPAVFGNAASFPEAFM
ncbi:hypothetical protein Taro_040827 [Colocasia esculenta]|uniref:Uncharacterized protein n=1 Tax=Colocasia esculenta TaxID=4460 RepID=A0A843WN07_COLES|nr:hypothetical protein [Colocasia esculenta]